MKDVIHSAYCPTCGQPNAIRHSPEWILTRFSGILGNIIAHLIQCRRERRAATRRELCETGYADRPGGPPVKAMDTISVMIHRERPRLIELGWDIVGPKITGNGYMLVPTEPDQPPQRTDRTGS